MNRIWFNEQSKDCRSFNLLLVGGHYEAIDADIEWDTGGISSEAGPRGNKVCSELRLGFKKPTLVLDFLSDSSSCKLDKFKSRLSIGKEFNIVLLGWKKIF